MALRPALYRALAKDTGAAYRINKDGCAELAKQELEACFDNKGAHFTGTTPLSLHLVAWGRSGKLAAVTVVRPKINGNRVSYAHGDLTEWWRVLPMGFEQGFTIAKRPVGHGKLMLALVTSRQDAGAPLTHHSRAEPAPGKAWGGNPVGKNIPTGVRDTNSDWITASASMTKKNDSNTLAWGKLRYGKLVVTDAKGMVVPARLKSEGNRVLIAVNDAHAVYPLTVDPLVWTEQRVTASDGGSGDEYGVSVALDGTTALIGAPFAGQGAVYVFTESGGSWWQVQKLTASDGAASDAFGISVALDGTTALVGAFHADVGGHTEQGAAYVFTYSGTWTQTQKLTASDGTEEGEFGTSVALDGTTAVIGAFTANVGGNTGQGAAYVFTEAGGSWSEAQKLTASDGATDDFFGYSVALDGMTILVGAYGAAINGNQHQGAVYVFGESGGTWTQTQKLAASDGATHDYFGDSVALDGTTAVIGAPDADVGSNIDQGAAYVFTEAGGNWSEAQKLTESAGGTQDEFGLSVALDGTTAVVGAPYADVGYQTEQGAVYLFTKAGGIWSDAHKLTASDGAVYDYFGFAVALDGTIALVGAPHADGLNASQGAAYFDGLFILSCPPHYTSYTATLAANATEFVPTYTVAPPGGQEKAILFAPAHFRFGVIVNGVQHSVPLGMTMVTFRGPPGTYKWGVKANNAGGTAALCLNHP